MGLPVLTMELAVERQQKEAGLVGMGTREKGSKWKDPWMGGNIWMLYVNDVLHPTVSGWMVIHFLSFDR